LISKMLRNYIVFIIIFQLALIALYADDLSVEKYDGRIIKSITFIQNNTVAGKSEMPSLKLRSGGRFYQKILNYDLRTLFSTGKFSDLVIDVKPIEEDRVDIIFNMKRALYVKGISFEGNEEFSSDVLEQKLNILYMTKFSPDVAKDGRRKLTEFYQEEGYYNAEIEWRFESRENSESGTLIYKIKPGKPATVQKVEFTDVIGLPERTDLIRRNIADIQSLIGIRCSQKEIYDWLREAREELKNKGYITTRLEYLSSVYNSIKNSAELKFKLITDGRVLLEFNNDEIDVDVFREISGDTTSKRLSPETRLEWARRIRQYFKDKGYSDARVYTSLKELDRKDAVFGIPIKKLRFSIIKGKKRLLKEISFKGNKSFENWQLNNLLVKKNDYKKDNIVLTPRLISQFNEIILNFYKSRGYLDAEIRRVELEEIEERRDFITTGMIIYIDEKKKNLIKEIQIIGEFDLKTEEFLEILPVKVGDVFRASDIDIAEQRIREFLSKQKEGDISVRTEVYKDKNYGMYIYFLLRLTDQQTIDKIIINGNLLTEEIFILRNLRLEEGKVLSRSKLLTAQLKLYDLGLFSKVEFVPLASDIVSEETRLILKVQESQPVLLTYGAGIDTENLFRGTFSVTHNNIAGKGMKATLRVLLGSKESSAQLSYQIPEIFYGNWDFFTSLFYEEHERDSFGLIRRGGVIQLSKESTPNLTHLISFNIENVDLFNVKISEYLIRPEDRAVDLASLASTIILDYRNDPFNPHDGFFLSSNIKWASDIFGSGVSFLKGYFQGNFYFPILDNTIFALGFRLGISEVFTEDKLLPPSERFFAGGASTSRAYELDWLGPIDEETGYPTGGNALLLANAEIRIPVFGDFGCVLFYDVGNVFEKSNQISIDKLAQSVGFGLRYNTPVGPLRVDFGVNPQDFEQNQIYISIGHAF